MRWSVVIPYYNEATGIEHTLVSVASQSLRDFRLILVDNASSDGSEEVCRRVLARFPEVEAVFHKEPRPGQVHALKRGLAEVLTEFVAVMDADTIYPAHYLERAQACYEEGGPEVVAAMAWRGFNPDSALNPLDRLHTMIASAAWPHQNHTSGAAHTFRTAVLRAAGGYDPDIWPFVIKDHELVNRVLKFGRQRYHPDLWCHSSHRRRDRRAVRWTLWERLVYHFHPARDRDWFFHQYLKPRFVARGQLDTKLRVRPWETTDVRSVSA